MAKAAKKAAKNNVRWTARDSVRYHAAIRAGDLETVRAMVEQAPSHQVVSSLKSVPFGDAKLMQLVLLHAKWLESESGDAPLWEAVLEGDEMKVRLLLEAGASPNGGEDKKKPSLMNSEVEAPLCKAVELGRLAIVKLLLDAGANTSMKDNAGYLPLDIATAQRNEEMVALLRAKRAPSSKKVAFSLLDAAVYGVTDRVLALWPKADADAREGALVQAAQAGRTATVKAMLAKTKFEPIQLEMALGFACHHVEDDGVVDALLTAGASPNTAGSSGSTDLMAASQKGCIAVVRRLLAAGARVDSRTDYGATALSVAKDAGRHEIVALLEQAGADSKADAKLQARVLRLVKPLVRKAWLPELARTGKSQARASHFGGAPFLVTGEAWPTCPDCTKPMPLFVQLDLATLPKPLASTGTAQLFHCIACDVQTTHLARVVDAKAKGAAGKPPRGLKLLAERSIAEWTPVDDLPYRDPALDAIKFPVAENHLGNILFPRNVQKDKLGGWPCWVQEATYPKRGKVTHDRLLLQLKTHGAVAHRWGDNGAGYLMQSSRDPTKLAFLWQTQ